MANGDDFYKVTVEDWVDMNKSIEGLNGTTRELQNTTERINTNLNKMNDTLDGFPCQSHGVSIKTNRRMVYGLWSFAGVLILAALGWLISNVA